MDFVDKKLKKAEIFNLRKKYGDYIKLTVDIKNTWVVAGGVLHTDGERLLLEKGSNQDDIWGGGISLPDRQTDSMAVLNIRPRLGNDNLEILDPSVRRKFHDIIDKYFKG